MKDKMKKTKIICTIGPASEDPKMLKKLVLAGMNVMRCNFSHGDHEEHGKKMQDVYKRQIYWRLLWLHIFTI